MHRHFVPERDQSLRESADLESVCRPLELSTPEVFPPNAFYGNDRVLKLYAGLPPDLPLTTVVPHGLVFDPAFVWEQERRSGLPTVLAYSDRREQVYRRATTLLPFRCAVPFAFLTSLIPGSPPERREGTLFFPGHSSHRATADADFVGMAHALTRLDPKFRPVTVCIYWRDHELGRHVPFLDCGLRVVSAGHLFDPAFLFRLYYLCQRHKYSASNHVGSSLAYSVIAGCRFFLLPGFGVRYAGQATHLADDLSRPGAEVDELSAAFAAPSDSPTPRQQNLVTRICGLDHRLDARTLRGLLQMSDRLDRLGLARDPRTGRTHAMFPRSLLRAARNRLLAARRWAGRLARGMRTA